MSEFVAYSLDGRSLDDFYASSKSAIDHEAGRLQSAAVELANPISEDALTPFLGIGDTVLDVGAGADTALGRSLTENSLRYIAVEPNKSFVDILRIAGVDAYQGDVVNLPIESNSVDAVHMRFLFGWLNEEQKKSALRQAARVLKPGEQKAVTIIDYDWMMTDGPAEYMDAVGVACDILGSFGFDYQYGAKITSDINRLASKKVFGPGVDYQILPLVVNEIDRTIGTGLPLLEEAVDSLKESLNAIGDIERTRSLEKALESIHTLDPGTNIALPGIATQTILLTKNQPSLERSEERLELFSGIYEAEDQSPTSVEGVMRVRRGSGLDEYVRTIQAYEYLKSGILTSESMIDDGVLCEASYPKKYLDRSVLFATVPEGKIWPTAAVRLVYTEPSEDPDVELRSLPTADHLGLTMNDHEIFPEGLPASGVFEVSSSIRNSKESGTFFDMSKAIIGLAAEARSGDYHTALMSTQVRMYGILKKIFGEDNFRLVEGPHKSTIPGASDTMDFVCISVDMRYFFERLWEHTKKTKETSKLSQDIHLLLENYLSYQRTAQS